MCRADFLERFFVRLLIRRETLGVEGSGVGPFRSQVQLVLLAGVLAFNWPTRYSRGRVPRALMLRLLLLRKL